MTAKIDRFLAEFRPSTPCLVVDLDRVEANFTALHRALPLAHIYYAVKANPAAQVLDRLAGLGARFDAASLNEVQAVLAAGVSADRLSFGHTVKTPAAISRAAELGVPMFAFDCSEELHKIARAAPGRQVYCRLAVANTGADWPLCNKFGTTAALAGALMRQAADLGLVPHGLSFHVGSQQTDPGAYAVAIGHVAALFTDLRDSGIDLGMINLGGGFPAAYREPVPSMEAFGGAIMRALTERFGNDLPEIVIEPGRAIVGDAGGVASEVVLVSRRDPAQDRRWVYLDIGRFGGLAETEGEAIRYRITTERDGEATGPVTIAGPTCDGVDVLYERSDYRMPLSLGCGDRVTLHAAGAYVSTYASQGFNGLAPLSEHYI